MPTRCYIAQEDAADPFILAPGLPGIVLDNLIELTEAPLDLVTGRSKCTRGGRIRYIIGPR